MGSMSIWHWIIVLAVGLLLFGGRGKISELMGDFAKGIKSFKKGLSEDEKAEEPAKTEPVKTIKTRKVPRNHVKAEATEKHPAQVDVYYEDIPVGYWTTVKFSGALPAARVNELLGRVEALQTAVKFAREEANGTAVTDQHVGEAVFGYLFG